MNILTLFVLGSGDNPLSHVVDHDLGLPLGITKHVLFMFIAAALCVGVMVWIARRMAGGETGGRWGNFFEVILIFLRDEVVRSFMGKDGDRFLPLIWTLFFFILFCNMIGMIPLSATATGNVNVTGALALICFVVYHVEGIRRNGLVKYLKATFLVGPWYLWWLMPFIELISLIMRPAALAIRLFANMVAGHTMLAVFMSFCLVFKSGFLLPGAAIAGTSVAAAVAVSFLEIFVAALQAFIFAFLVTVFLSMAIHPEH